MGYDYQGAFERIKAKVSMIIARHNKAVEERNRALALIEELKAELNRKDDEIRSLKVEVENLTVVTTACPTREDVARSRAMLSDLVREIDKCIVELST